MVDAMHSKCIVRKGVRVRIPLRALVKGSNQPDTGGVG